MSVYSEPEVQKDEIIKEVNQLRCKALREVPGNLPIASDFTIHVYGIKNLPLDFLELYVQTLKHALGE